MAMQIQKIASSMGGAALMGVHLLLPFLHQMRTHWGATEDELKRTWPGDELVPHPRGGFTHGITIHAPASKVWPWIAQIGQDKAGFYSYEVLENLVGCKIRNAEQIQPQWQDIRVGDVLRLHPQVAVPIEMVDPGHAFVMFGKPETDTGQDPSAGTPSPENFASVSWLFCVYDIENGFSRFISRWRVNYPPGLKNEIMMGRYGLEPIAAVMDFKMLKSVRYLAERAAAA